MTIRTRLFATLPVLVAVQLWLAPAVAMAALEVVVAVSPREPVAGERAEVLIRTFVPFEREDLHLDVPEPDEPMPVGGRFWAVLYAPRGDYRFQVATSRGDGRWDPISVVRDPGDATLYRGTFVFHEPGDWTVRVRNTGTEFAIHVKPHRASATEPGQGRLPTTDSTSGPTAAAPRPLVALLSAAVIVLGGIGALGRTARRRA